MTVQFSTGSKGFIVADLQKLLGIKADGIYGKATHAAVKQFQMRSKLPPTGTAGSREFEMMGMAFPKLFLRAMNLVSCFEGTGFGDCNLRDIDGAGLTMGIAGFTTVHGEVQNLVRKYLELRPQCVDSLSNEMREELQSVLATNHVTAWHSMFYAGRYVRSDWEVLIRYWGGDPGMQQLQLGLAEELFWKSAVATAKKLGFSSDRAMVFFLDVAVQNGGWRASHLSRVRTMAGWNSGNEISRLKSAARAVAACAARKWQNDVLSRKLAIAAGAGVVHGDYWDLEHYALT